MATKCKNCPLRAREVFEKFSTEELQFMEKFKVGELSVEAGTTILMEGSNSPQLFTALHGMGLRHTSLPNGRRQVVNFVMPGDFIGLQAGIMGEMQHTVEATNHMTLCVFDRGEIWSMFKTHPARAYSLTWAAAIEEHFLGDALATLGQRTALQRVAWALCRVFVRGQELGLISGAHMPLPYRQQDLADALGLSLVHTNKTLARLRERQFASWQDGILQVSDIEKLADIAETDLEANVCRPLM